MHHPNPIVMQAQKQRLSQANAAAGAYPAGGAFPNQRPVVASPGVNSSSVKSDTPENSVQSPSTDHAGSQPLNAHNKSRNDDGYRTGDISNDGPVRASTFPSTGFGGSSRPNPDGFARPAPITSNPQSFNGSSNFSSAQNYSRPLPPSAQQPQSPASYQPHQNFPPLTTLPPPGYETMTRVSATDSSSYPPSQNENPSGDVRMGHTGTDATLPETMTPTYTTVPIFGNQGIERSPFAMADDFAAWLFNEQSYGPNSSPMGYPGAGIPSALGSNTNFTLQAPYFAHDPVVNGYFSQPVPAQHPMAVNNLIDTTNMQQMALSEERRHEIIDLIEARFNDKHAPVITKDDVLRDLDRADTHVLSLNMLQTYIGSYWVHFHPQMPILHKPTFEANKCPELLLIAIIALGASCLEKKRHGFEVTQSCSELSNFLAWHLRWEIFMAKDSRPAAKLWVFQALLLLEIFEKMYSSRPLHERAHIHHATTLTLMRRGSSLIGRSSVESPPPGLSSSRHGSVNGGSSAYTYTADEWWNQWIHSEATRRAAFAAFVMDSIHATMFGHSAVMVAHEMRLPLPCDEALWSATSSAEIGRVEQSLAQHGIKPTTFLDGLKKTLNNTPVRTNSFGRTILMAGLLSVSWHMNQRDLQVSSLGVSQALGGRDRWRGALTRAFDFWKADLDDSISKTNDGSTPSYNLSSRATDDENIFENRTVLHHMAHMAMHVDIVDCQIFAGASRLLGRSITPQDYNGAQRRMKEGWAPTARARDATFYALRFLSQVLMPDEHGSPHQKPASSQVGRDASGLYSARDDILLNRPWVLYFATLIVWSYGYALDGPITPIYALQDYSQVIKDMQGFLNRVGKVRSPDDLQHVTNRNACLGLLALMRDTFARTRWELLHEASLRLTKCIEKLANGQTLELPSPPP
jgi:transcription factor-like protein